MPHLTSLLGFALVSLGMVLTPGPNMIYLISRSLAQGSAAGMVSLGGVALGFVFYMLCAAFGITALLFAVPYAYDALRFGGALYLACGWPGRCSSSRTAARRFRCGDLPVELARAQTVRDAVFVTNLLNPENRDGCRSGAAAAIHRDPAHGSSIC